MTTLKLAGACALALIVAATAATEANAEPGDPRDYAATSQRARTVVRHSRAKPRQEKSEGRVVALLQRLIADNSRMERELIAINKKLRPDGVAALSENVPLPSRNPLLAAPMPIPDPSVPPTLKGYAGAIAKSAKLKDLTPKLAEKVREILDACPGSKISSGYRPGARVRGSGRPSLHSHYPSKAVDMAGNPACIKRMLAKWPGGLSTDYAAVAHYHISYAPKGREWGARFAHYGTRAARKTRYAQASQ